MKRKIVISLSIISVTLILFCIFYVASFYYIKTNGITVKSLKDIEITKNVPHHLQNNPKWKDDLIGDSNINLGGYGCLVSSLSSSLNTEGINITPKELNQSFNKQKAYTESGEVIWYKINEVYPQIDYDYKRVFNSKTIEKALERNQLPIVKVKYQNTGIFHWVLIVGAKDNDFLIMDPLNQEKNFTKLSQTHGKVYAYRILIKQK